MEKKIYTGGGLGSQMLVMGDAKFEVMNDDGSYDTISNIDSYERVDLPPGYADGGGLFPTWSLWHDDHANRKERRRTNPKTKVRFR